MSPFKKTILPLILSIVVIGCLYYALIPPLNVQSTDMWEFLIYCVIIVTVFFGIPRAGQNKSAESPLKNFKGFNLQDLLNKKPRKPHVVSFPKGKKKGPLTVALGIIVVFIAVLVVGNIASSSFFNAKSYSKLLTVEKGDFAEDISEISMNSVPVVDRSTAERLGNKSIGEMSDLVSQYAIDETDTAYTQINYQNAPYRVSPLIYADIFKWITNTGKGLPGYVTVNMATQETKLVRLEKGNYIRYSTAEHFNRYLYRYLRFRYPTKIFGEASFELDDDGTPYWIVPTVKYRIMLFGGKDYDGAILVNACTGEYKYYSLDEIPNWCDKVFSADLVYSQLESYGKYKSGFWNSLIGQSGVLCPTGSTAVSLFSDDDEESSTSTSSGSGYNYLAIDDDVYMYTGMTSANSDESLVGFVLVNLRTKETSYYSCTGAVESAAMSSAEGQVQQMSYVATSPLLLNIADRPTYFLSLKDGEGLVKMYAFIDVERYQIVGTGSTVSEAQKAYVSALASDDEVDVDVDDIKDAEATDEMVSEGTIEAFESVVKDSNSYYYFKLKDDSNIYIASIDVSDSLPFMKAGDKISVVYSESSKGVREVSSIK